MLKTKPLRILGISLALLFAVSVQAQDDTDLSAFFDDTHTFLKRYVKNGRVDYERVKSQGNNLEDLVGVIAETDLSKLKDREAKAFLINAYNLLVIKSVVEAYPVESVKDIPGFFSASVHTIGSQQVSLRELDDDMLLKRFKDPRIHFVLSRGSVDCAPLLDAAYYPDELDRQLDRRTRQVLNDPNYIRVDNEDEVNYLAPLLEDYDNDFPDRGADIWNWVNPYRIEALDTDYDMEFYKWNWALNDFDGDAAVTQPEPTKKKEKNQKPADEGRSNVQTYTPSILLKKGQVEAKAFNNLYTQTAWFNGDRQREEFDTRSTFFTTTIQGLYGISKSARWNLGFMANIRGVSNDSVPVSPTHVFRFRNDDQNRWTQSNIGPSIKFQPLKGLSNLSVLSSFLIPIANDLEGSPWTDWDRYIWWNQFFYDQKLTDDMRLFAAVDLLFRFPRNSDQQTHLASPVSLFYSYFPTSKSTIYVQGQYWPQFDPRPACIENPQPWEDNSDFCNTSDNGRYYMTQWFSQAGIGGKYQITKALEIEVSYTNFWAGRSAGAGATYNMGIRYLR